MRSDRVRQSRDIQQPKHPTPEAKAMILQSQSRMLQSQSQSQYFDFEVKALAYYPALLDSARSNHKYLMTIILE